MVKAIPMEDWLRGCIYHDGRHGYVTLPIDKVHQIANYIQRTRRSGMDGLIDLTVEPIAEQTEPQTHEIRTNTHECVKDMHDKTEPNSSEIPNNCEHITEGVWNAGFKTGYDKGHKDAQKVKDSQDLVKDLVKAFCEDGTWLERQGVYTLTLAEAKQRAVDIIESVTQTETQNSNLTFEKRTMLDCYNCKRFETEDECIECRYEPKDEPQLCDICRYYNSNIPCGSTPSACKEADKFAEEFVDGLKKLKPKTDDFFRNPTAEERKAVADYIDSISVPTGVNVFDLMDEPQTDCAWK